MNPVFVVIFMVCGHHSRRETPEVVIIDKIVKVIDGDTFVCHVAHVPQDSFDAEVILRLDGVEAPEGGELDFCEEIRSRALKSYVESRLRQASFVILRNLRRDDASRLVADVFVDWQNLSASVAEIAKATDPEGAMDV